VGLAGTTDDHGLLEAVGLRRQGAAGAEFGRQRRLELAARLGAIRVGEEVAGQGDALVSVRVLAEGGDDGGVLAAVLGQRALLRGADEEMVASLGDGAHVGELGADAPDLVEQCAAGRMQHPTAAEFGTGQGMAQGMEVALEDGVAIIPRDPEGVESPVLPFRAAKRAASDAAPPHGSVDGILGRGGRGGRRRLSR
jgi:hypothetical protein